RGRDGAAQDQARAEAAVPHAARAIRADHGDDLLPRTDVGPRRPHVGAPHHLARDRPRDLLRLRPLPQRRAHGEPGPELLTARRRTRGAFSGARGPLALVPLAALVCAACARPAPPPPTPRSVLLVTIDTLRADRVAVYGDAQARTPQLDALARGGVLFERAYS